MANYFLKEKTIFRKHRAKKEIHDVKQKVPTKKNVNL